MGKREAWDQPSLDDFFHFGPLPQPERVSPRRNTPQPGVQQSLFDADIPETPVVHTVDTAASAPSPALPAPAVVQESTGATPSAPVPPTVPKPVVESEPAGVPRFRPSSQIDLAPSGPVRRVRANLAALEVLATLKAEDRPATSDEQTILAQYAGWGGDDVWKIFDESKTEFSTEREQLKGLLTDSEWETARSTTLNANYTDAAIVESIWSSLGAAGFEGGSVLEPGCGSGNFIGFAPEGAHMVGVEIDPITAQIAHALYPDATIRTESFGDTHLPQGHFDLTVGNVPFGKFPVHDPVYNPGNRLNIHNHFIVKSIALTRPGGLVAVLTSSYTMDARNPDARARMAEMADLVTAIRLPSGAHRAAGGTDVVTDLLVFKRRPVGDTTPASTEWLSTEEVEFPVKTGGDPQPIRMNTYWGHHPDQILGTARGAVGMHGVFGLEIVPDTSVNLGDLVESRLTHDLAIQAENGLGYEPRDNSQAVTVPVVLADPGLIDDEIVWTAEKGFQIVKGGVLTSLAVPKTQTEETKHLLSMKDKTRALLQHEASTFDDTQQLDDLRQDLKATWESYVATYGPVTRLLPWGKPKVNEDGSEEIQVRVPQAVQRVKNDPYGLLVTALEIWDEDQEKPRPAGILLARQIVPRPEIHGVDTAEDGLAVVLDQTAKVDISRIATLMGGVPESQVIADLGERVYQLPTGEWQTAAAYLSGDVRVKLEEARTAAIEDPDRFGRNVTALEAVLPVDIPMGDIRPRLGSIWIPDTDVRDFMTSILGRAPQKCIRQGPAKWDIKVDKWLSERPESVSEWGTSRMPFDQIVIRLAENRVIQVTDKVFNDDGSEGKPMVNIGESVAAQAKATMIATRFAEWVWEDDERAVRLSTEYNRRFNSRVSRSYDDDGKLLSLPGLSASFTPHPWQRAAVARILAEPSVGLFHEVGAGKTAEMIMGSMELKRLGLVSKPLVVVPNHMLMQFTSEWLRLYPQAKVLAADSTDTKKTARQAFMAKAAMNDWDAIIMTQTAFGAIPVSAETQQMYIAEQVKAIDEFVSSLKEQENQPGQDKRAMAQTVKQAEKARESLKADVAKSLDKTVDAGLTFEQMGADLLVVDEIHMFKNLKMFTSIKGMPTNGAKRASNLDMKLGWLRDKYGDTHTLIGATGTPISNSVAEMYVMQHYFRPDVLTAAGIRDFDGWAATFAELVSAPELKTDAQSFGYNTRLARFINLPELVSMMREFGDVKTADDLDLKRPDLAINPETGKREPQMIVLDRDEELTAYIDSLTDRISAIQGGIPPWQDNVLKVITDGRHASLDMRLRDPDAHGGVKIDAAADKLAQVYMDHRDDVYFDEDGQPSPTRGSLQIVFCDLGTPKEGWNMYDGLKDALVARGVPASTVRFVHDATTKDKKDRLFAECRNGKVSVLIGSTEKMGVGTNIQRRAVHMLHMDAPWKPAEVDQRNGRILRQGNQNQEIQITYMVVKKTYDALMWQTVERKAKFIHQLMDGTITDRVAEDVADVSNNTALFGQLKAAGTDNPLLIRQAELTTQVAHLTALERAHRRNIQGIQVALSKDRAALKTTIATLATLKQAQAATINRDNEFVADVGTSTHSRRYNADPDQYLETARTYQSKADAAEGLKKLIDNGEFTANEPVGVARLQGHVVEVQMRPYGSSMGTIQHHLTLRLRDAPMITRTVLFDIRYYKMQLSFPGLVTRMENMINDIPAELVKTQARIEELNHRLSVNERLDLGTFAQADDLTAARQALEEINGRVSEASRAPTLPQDAPPSLSVGADYSAGIIPSTGGFSSEYEMNEADLEEMDMEMDSPEEPPAMGLHL